MHSACNALPACQIHKLRTSKSNIPKVIRHTDKESILGTITSILLSMNIGLFMCMYTHWKHY